MRIRHAAGAALATMLTAGPVLAAPGQQMLVSTGWLASHLNDPNLVLLHVGDDAAFKAAHIPGARLVHLTDIAEMRDGRTLEVPEAADLRRRLQALGITDRSRVIVYFGTDWVSPATRVLFTLQTAGLGARAGLLDGGMPKWRREGGAVTAVEAPPVKPGPLAPVTLRPTVVDATFVRTYAGKPGYALVDARAPVFYTGLQPGGPHEHMKRGHIPGAKNVPFTSVTNDDLTFKQPGELTALFRKAGVRPGDRVIAYCHIGQQATAVWLAARTAGIDVLFYDGAFEDWALRDLPVEQ